MEAYTSYLDEHSATYVATNMGVADIPFLSERDIKSPLPSRLRSLWKVKEQVFTGPVRSVSEIAFERRLCFPIDDQVSDLLVSLDFAPC